MEPITRRTGDAQTDIPLIRAYVDRLMTISGRLLHSPIKYNEIEDHLGFMILAYVSKQTEHLQSVRVLVDAGRDRDSLLIARTMTEGHALLFWAANEPDRVPLLWRAYAWVADWRTMRENEKQGITSDLQQKARIEENLLKYDSWYLSPTTKGRIKKGKTRPADPYDYKWYDSDLASIFDKVEGHSLYDFIYRPGSDWMHWNIKPIAQAIQRGDATVSYSETDPKSAITSLLVGFQALYESLMLLVNHFAEQFGPNLTNDLTELYKAYTEQPAPTS